MNVLNALAGLVCGVLSGYGIGGGSLLLIYMTELAHIEQAAAQGMNLVYFLPTSAAALVSHVRNGLVDLRQCLWAALPGMVVSAVTAYVATGIDPGSLRRTFGIFLIAVGVKMFLKK